jgi:hypothetical protein
MSKGWSADEMRKNEASIQIEIIVGHYRGFPLNDVDAQIYIKRLSSNCFVNEDVFYDRKIKKLVPTKGCCVIDFHDGEFVNFTRIKGNGDKYEQGRY